MQIFLPDFLTLNLNSDGAGFSIKQRTAKRKRNFHTDSQKQPSLITHTLQSAKTLRTKSLNSNNVFSIRSKLCEVSLFHHQNKASLFPSQNRQSIHCRKNNNFRVNNSPRIKQPQKIEEQIKEKYDSAKHLNSPFLLTKPFTYQQKLPLPPKTADIRRNKFSGNEIKYKRKISNSLNKSEQIFSEQNSIYRPWSPTKNQLGEWEMK